PPQSPARPIREAPSCRPRQRRTALAVAAHTTPTGEYHPPAVRATGEAGAPRLRVGKARHQHQRTWAPRARALAASKPRRPPDEHLERSSPLSSSSPTSAGRRDGPSWYLPTHRPAD